MAGRAALWIDDERPRPDDYTHHATTSSIAIVMLRTAYTLAPPMFEVVSFDHDLGGDDTSRPVLTWMIENNVWPDEIRFHTANPVGRQWLLGTARRYAPGWVHVNEHDPWRDPTGMRMG